MPFLLIIATLLSGLLQNQPSRFFEGKIIYSESFRTTSGDTLNYDLYALRDGKNQTFYKGADYFTTTLDGKPVDLYRARDNKFYSFSDKGKPIASDASISSSVKQVITLLKDTATIAGYFCHSLQLETDHGVSKIFYTSQLQLPVDSIRQHELHNLNVLFAATKGGYPLKSIIKWKMDGIVVTTEAVSVQWQPLPDSIFQMALHQNNADKLN
jgi:hypothetical protein